MKGLRRIIFARTRRTASAAAGLLLLATPAYAGDSPSSRPHAAYLEVGGSSFFGANCDRMVSRHAGVRVGAGFVPIVGAVTGVAMANYVAGSGLSVGMSF